MDLHIFPGGARDASQESSEIVEGNDDESPDHMAIMEGLNDHSYWALRSRSSKLEEEIQATIRETARLKMVLKEKEKLVDDIRKSLAVKKLRKIMQMSERASVQDAMKSLELVK